MAAKIMFKTLTLSLIFWFIVTAGFAANVIDVLKTTKNLSIKEAVEKASPGDTLFITAGIYHEAGIEINKPLTLIGEKGVIIDGRDLGQILTIKAKNVTISGLEFHNTPISYISDNAAIKLDEAINCLIINNTFVNNFFAVYLAKSSHCRIIGNIIRSEAKRESASGNGIHLWYCKNIAIENNHITAHRDGIYFEFVEDSYIKNNHSEKNLRYGLHFMFSDRCKYVQNTFINNGAGVAVMYTNNIEMLNNRFERNWGSASFGLLLKDITDSKIENNIFLQNSIGIYAESSNRIQVMNNTFQKNGWALKIMGNCLDNNFNQNNFIANTFDISTNTRRNFNNFDSNYWDNYDGYDLDKNGIGDVAFHPVSMFSFLVEKNEPALILIRSFFVHLLNVAETVLPVLTPKTLIDNSPLMRRVL